MSIYQRKHIRLTLDIPAFRFTETGDKIGLTVYQISIGGCLVEWDENISIDDIFRMEIQLPNENWLPLQCEVLYLIKGDGIGAKFQDITIFEQELIGEIMSEKLVESGVASPLDPFAEPNSYFNKQQEQSEENQKVLVGE